MRTTSVTLSLRHNDHCKRLSDPSSPSIYHLETYLPFTEAVKLPLGNANVRPPSDKKEPVKVIVKENLFRWVNWDITKHSADYEKQDYRTIHFPVDVPADGEAKVTYTAKYTW